MHVEQASSIDTYKSVEKDFLLEQRHHYYRSCEICKISYSLF